MHPDAMLDLDGSAVSVHEPELPFITRSNCSSQIEPDVLPRICQALRELPRTQRLALVLWLCGYDYFEITQITGADLGTVRSRIHHARHKARQLLVDLFSA
jgi:RNA polymerase sigma-70 factor (ECF subfamily)